MEAMIVERVMEVIHQMMEAIPQISLVVYQKARTAEQQIQHLISKERHQ